MYVIDAKSGRSQPINISTVTGSEYKSFSKERYWFDWNKEKGYDVFKLCIKGSEDILGLISLETFEIESGIEIRLIAVSKDNRGKNKEHERIVGNLIAFAGLRAIHLFAEWACISLVPKTQLINYYKSKYYMIQAGRSLFLDGLELIQLIKEYTNDK